MIAQEKRALLKAHKKALKGLMFYTSLTDLRKNRDLLPYLHSLFCAWHELRLDGVLCIHGLPTLYLTIRDERVSHKEAAKLQRLFWNQGLATILVVVDPVNVRIYSGLARPSDPGRVEDESESLVETIGLSKYALNIDTFLMKLATGSYYRENEKRFRENATVDAYLLDNLRALRDKIMKESPSLTIGTVHSFLARILFVCYLTDRDIIDLGDYEECRCSPGTSFGDMLAGLQTEDKKQRALCGLFSKLKDDFNGSMFEQATMTECRQLNSGALNELTRFLQGDELGTGQLTLDFWAYDFRWIPVETISVVYEDFLKKEAGSEKRTKGAYYTPRFLAESVVDLALRDCDDFKGKRFLDPACGSGIFLVTLFNRLAAAWMDGHPRLANDYSRKADALKAILRDQIRGVDSNPTACRIACFSLYLAFLDCFDPPDIKKYVKRNGKLPAILKYINPSDNAPPLFPVVYEEDFLKPTEPLPKGFDFVVGNPPWSGRGATEGLHHLFAKKIPEHLASEGTTCILLPSKTLLNENTNDFQNEWLRSISLKEVVLLADFRKILFKEAKCPSMIVRFQASKPDLTTAKIEYVTPKVSRIDYRDGVIPVSSRDRKEIPLSQLLSSASEGVAPAVWKTHLWGTPRDIKFLELLRQMPTLGHITDSPENGKRWVKGEGLQPYYPQKAKNNSRYPKGYDNPWRGSFSFLSANIFTNMIVHPEDCTSFDEYLRKKDASTQLLRRSPSKELFQPPLVLVSQGIGRYRAPKVAFCDFQVVFQHSLQSIGGPQEDENLLLFLTVYLRSKLARYFMFHTSANWGTEREKVHLNELLRVPFPLPGSQYIHQDAEEIVHQVAKRVRDMRRNIESEARKKKTKVLERAWREDRVRQAEALQAELEPLIYQYFGLIEQEIILVEDTVDVIIPSATPSTMNKKIPSSSPINRNDVGGYRQGLAPYADTLTNTLNEWAVQLKSEVCASASGGVHTKSGMVCLTVELTKKPVPFKNVPPDDETVRAVTQLAQAATTRIGYLDYLRGIIVFEGQRIYIFKPSDLVGWTRTAALNDAAEIYARIAAARQSTAQGGDR